jgi:hypothetical protein
MPVTDRRSFVRSMGAAAIASTVPPPLKAILVPENDLQARGTPRVALLSEPGFPTIDVQALDERTLQRALEGFEATLLRVDDLDRLDPQAFDVFISAYGSAFPKEAWERLLGYLESGGNWVNIGGVPLAVPVRRKASGWRPETRQTAYHKQLGISQAFPVDLTGLATYDSNPAIDYSRTLAGAVSARTAYELYYRFTREKEYPDEDGSDGPREAVVEPLVSVRGAAEHAVAAPIVRIDRLLGPHAGGRWILANLDGSLSAAALRSLIRDAALGAHRLRAQPSFACYRDGETPSITVTLKSPSSQRRKDASCRVRVFDDGDNPIAETTLPLEGAGFAITASASLQADAGAALQPGLYRVDAAIESRDAALDGLKAKTGFWIFDRELLASGTPFTTDAHTLLRDGKPFIVTGTSYMATDVHRRFLLEPNPWVWDRDFAQMKRVGINMIRTGIWTGWRNYMAEVGRFNETALRALDAFLLTSRKYDIPVIFTFFAFIPPSWGGANPYLDPRAIDAQKTFLSLIAQRYKDMSGVIWDLINEPSFCSPDHLWLTRPNYDEHEVRAWRAWLRDRFAADSESELERTLSEKWRTLPGEALDLPRPDEFGDRNIFEGSRPLKAMDYRLFANDMFTRWAKQMADALHAASSPSHLVTVGQDEGGTYERPAPMFHGPVVAFTSNHTWWLNDDLLWDSVVTKTPDRPNLISETGIMFYEKIDGSAWRSEADARDLLERKLALATAVGGAGWIEWIWNTNPYMPLDNEAAIGLLRPDGTAKPEFLVLRDLARFVAESQSLLEEPKREPAVMVIPHSHMFAARNFATQATQRCVRAMHYRCRVAMGAVSEYALDRLVYEPRLLIVPSPRVLTQEAWQRLTQLAERGATLLVTGPIDYDEHWLPVPRLERFGIDARTAAVANEEDLELDGATLRLSYRNLKIQRVEKAIVAGGSPAGVVRAPLGRGSLIWSPLSVELAEQTEPTVALYRYALARAGIEPAFELERDDPGVLAYPAIYRDAVLYALVSELGTATTVALGDRETGSLVQASLGPGRAALALLDRRDGKLVGWYGNVSGS